MLAMTPVITKITPLVYTSRHRTNTRIFTGNVRDFFVYVVNFKLRYDNSTEVELHPHEKKQYMDEILRQHLTDDLRHTLTHNVLKRLAIHSCFIRIKRIVRLGKVRVFFFNLNEFYVFQQEL